MRRLITKRWHEYALSLLIPLGVLCIAFAANDLYPFGSRSVLIWDMKIQYLGIFGWFCNVLHGQGGLLYSFTMGLGEGTVALLAYYLTSPFNLLLLFFDADHIPEFFGIVTLVKIPFAGLTCYAFLRRRYGRGTGSLALSTCYALSGFLVGECSNLMWIDGAIMLPLVALGTYEAAHEGRHATLFASVACAVVFNWYTGYMDCLFSVLYFVYCCHEDRGWSGFWGRALSYLATMALGVGTSMFLLLPCAIALMQGTEGSLTLDSILRLTRAINFWTFPSYLCVTSSPSISEEITPAIYLSSFALVPALAFFLAREVPPKRRVALALLLAASVAGILFNGVEAVWSCLRGVTSFYFRHAFVVDFTLVIVAAEGWRVLEGLDARASRRACWRSAGILAAAIYGSIGARAIASGASPFGTRPLVIEACSLVAAALLLARGCDGDARRSPSRAFVLSIAALFVALALEQGYDAYASFEKYSDDVDAYSEYLSDMKATYQGISELSSGDAPLVGQSVSSYMGEYAARSSEYFLWGTQGMNEYTSMVNGSVERLMKALGYTQSITDFGYFYNSPMLVPDTLLGVDYVIASSCPVGFSETSGVAVTPSWYSLSVADRSLPFAYGVAADAGNVDWTDDPFENQQAMASELTGADASALYSRAQVAEAPSTGDGATREFSVTTTGSGPTYLNVSSINSVAATGDNSLEASVSVDGRFVQCTGGRFNSSIIYLGEYDSGTTLDVSIQLLSPDAASQKDGKSATELFQTFASDDIIDAETLDQDLLTSLLSRLDDGAMKGCSVSDGQVSCDFDAEKDETALFRIPYDKGWKVTVDGEPAQIVQCVSGLTGVAVSQGSHHIEFEYETPGLVLGTAISIASLAGFVLLERRRRAAST